MLALTMPIPVAYHLPTVMLSLLAAIAASGVALFVVSRTKMSVWQGIAGSVVMGSGIASMHYIGMAAMRCSTVIVYDRRIVAASIGLAIAVFLVDLHLGFRVRDEQRLSRRKTISALAMGSAIPLMHYTGMWAATFRRSDSVPDLTHAIGISTLDTVVISASSLLVLGVAIASSFFDRFLAIQKGDLKMARQHELYFRTLAEAVPEIMWTADADGVDDYFNRKWFDYTGMTIEQSRGTGGTVVVHPDDMAPCLESGKTHGVSARPTTWSIDCAGKTEPSGGSYAGAIPSAIKKGRSSNGSAPVLTLRVKSKTSRFWKSKFWNEPCNWPMPTPDCKRRCWRKTALAENSINRMET